MRARSALRWVGWLGLGTLLGWSRPADAQAREHVRIHRHVRPHLHRHPVVYTAPPPALRSGPWDASRARFVLSAESLLGFAYLREVETATTADGTQRKNTTTGPSAHLFKGADLLDPFGASRLGFDGVVGPGLTLGGSVGYATADQTEENSGGTDSLTLKTFVLVPRLGFLLAPSRYVGVWLRGGVGYASISIDPGSGTESKHGWAVVLDPMLVMTPLPHVGILFGPSFDIGFAGGEDFPGVTESLSNKWSSYGASGGIALLF